MRYQPDYWTQRKQGFVLIFLLWGCFTASLRAQEDIHHDVYHYTANDGLSSNHVYQVFQDSRGLIWMLTGKGIDLFDGVEFECVMSWDFSPYVYQNRICFEDEEGLIWVKLMLDSRVVFKWINTRTKQVVDQAPALFRSCKGEYIDIAAAPAHTLLLLDKQNQLWRVKKGAEPALLFSGFGSEFAFCSHQNNDSIIWLQSQIVRERESDSYIQYTGVLPGKQVVLFNTPDRSHRSFVNSDGTLWSVGKYYYARIALGKPVEYKPVSAAIPGYKVDYRDNSNFVFDPENEVVWLVNQGVLKAFKPGGELIYDFSNNKNINGPEFSFDMFLDRQGILWVGTIGGVYKIIKNRTKFRRLVWKSPLENTDKRELPCRGMVFHRDGRIYFNASTEVYSVSPGLDDIRLVDSEPVGLYALCEDLDGRLINGITTIYHLDPVTGKKVVHNLPALQKWGEIWSILPRYDRIWLGNNEGILYYDRSKEAIVPFEQYNGYDLLRHSCVYQMLFLEQSRKIWMISSTGIYVIDPEQGVTGRYWNGGTGADFLPADNIRHLSIGESGAIWLATSTGLIYWDQTSGILRTYGEKEGLINTNLYAVYPDKFGSVWFSSDAGIGQMDCVSGKIRYYQTQDGVTHNEFNRISHLQLANGTLLFGSMNGITVFHPEDFKDAFKNSKNGILNLTGATAFSGSDSKEVNLLPEIMASNGIEIEPDQLFLKLRFALSDYTEVSELSYSYTLEGLHQYWFPLLHNEIQLVGIPSGRYLLKVRAKNSTGVNYDSEYVLPVYVKAPFYLRTWFLVLMLILLIVLVNLLIKWRSRFLLNQQRELEKEVKLRTKKIELDKEIIEYQALLLKQQDTQKTYLIGNLMHEMRTPITLILGPIKRTLQKGGLGQQNTKMLSIAERNAKQILEHVNTTLDLISLENRTLSIHQTPVLIDALFRDLTDEFRVIARLGNISLRFHSEVLPELEVLICEKHLRTILSNLLSNAIKYTASKGHISVYLTYRAEELEFTVRDSGRGIHPDDLPHIFERFFQTQQPDAPVEGGTGIGLALCKELAELMNGRITVESTQGEGTAFKVVIPARSVSGEVVSEKSAQPVLQAGGTTLVPSVLFQKWKFSGRNKEHSTILVAEDNLEMQRFIGAILESGYQLHFVGNGKEALAYLEVNPLPDLLLTDIMMPEMDGFQLVKKIKSRSEYSGMPIIVLSARSEQTNISLLADGYLAKPFEEAELLTTVRRLMERQLSSPEQEQTSENSREGVELCQIDIRDLEWLRQMEKITIESISNPTFTADTLAGAMFMGRTAFFQEVKRLTGMTPNQYIREVRLLEARWLLQRRVYSNFSSVVSAIGMKSESYVSLLFRQRFGVSPMTYFQHTDKTY